MGSCHFLGKGSFVECRKKVLLEWDISSWTLPNQFLDHILSDHRKKIQGRRSTSLLSKCNPDRIKQVATFEISPFLVFSFILYSLFLFSLLFRLFLQVLKMSLVGLFFSIRISEKEILASIFSVFWFWISILSLHFEVECSPDSQSSLVHSLGKHFFSFLCLLILNQGFFN